MTTPTQAVEPLSEEELARILSEAEDWERDGFVSKAANNVTKVWAARAKGCASYFKRLLATLTSERAKREEVERRVFLLENELSNARDTIDYWKQSAEAAEAQSKADLEKVCQFMLVHGFATGHADTLDDALAELSWQVEERLYRMLSAEAAQEALARSAESVAAMTPEEREAMHKAQRESWAKQDLD